MLHFDIKHSRWWHVLNLSPLIEQLIRWPLLVKEMTYLKKAYVNIMSLIWVSLPNSLQQNMWTHFFMRIKYLNQNLSWEFFSQFLLPFFVISKMITANFFVESGLIWKIPKGFGQKFASNRLQTLFKIQVGSQITRLRAIGKPNHCAKGKWEDKSPG